ncbi:hypothetical protein GALMADRAFT_246135 [Galerina marginata CBS 339.88]|uniref:Uncharacterized protein n=1 Tax=Galerina marginata (strain CBS 339.88) TaxID=685588 RepID=A0A067TDE8_GALM3|nr:hypothetical protein GALMADRAFT_246135 [Galerina marginata CBS 339.88]
MRCFIAAIVLSEPVILNPWWLFRGNDFQAMHKLVINTHQWLFHALVSQVNVDVNLLCASGVESATLYANVLRSLKYGSMRST